jgi:hypothetical protein
VRSLRGGGDPFYGLFSSDVLFLGGMAHPAAGSRKPRWADERAAK